VRRHLILVVRPMADSIMLSIISDAVIATLHALGADKRFTAEQLQSARIALSAAFHATEGYYAALSAGGQKDEARQHEIAHLWDEIAIRMEPFNSHIANRLGLKSRYWREGAAWSDDQIAAAKIQLGAIRRDANFALIRNKV
jgi:hypothetical protein